MIYLILLSFINQSVATSERSRALYANPAGLSIHPSPEISVRSEDYWISMSIPFPGLAGGIRFMSDSIEYLVGGSPVYYKDRFSIGYLYTSWDARYTVGTMIRPNRWTSLGLTTSFPSRGGYDFDMGVAVMPFWERFVMYSDFRYEKTDGETDFYVKNLSGTLEVLDGVKLNLSYLPDRGDFKDGDFYGGVELSLGNILLGGFGNQDEQEGIVTASVIPYPTFMKPKPRSVIVEIKGDYPEVPELKGMLGKEHSFYNLLNLLNYIRKNEKIETVVVNVKNNSLGLAQTEEVRNILAEINKDKNVIMYSHNLRLKELYLTTAVDKVAIPPGGEVFFPGIYMSKMYLQGTLEKLDIEPEFERVGRYKSAVEMFTRKSISKADREQMIKFMDDLVSVLVYRIAEKRDMEVEGLKSLIDSIGMFMPEVAKEHGLVDTILYFDQVKEMAGIEKEGKVWRGRSIPRGFVVRSKPKIAILALEGSIIVGESSNSPIPVPLFGSKTIGSETVVKQLNKLRKDKSVKAVIIRIDSGGGSSLASDLIYRAILRLKEEKPVIISMGNIAASGGYYISAPGTKILADKTTLTGSIGIFGFKFVTEGFYNKLGINRDVVKWGKHADAMGGHRSFTEEEQERFEKMIHYGYKQFIGKVADCRELTTEEVDSVGMGRIWSGKTAREIKLIDSYGGLMDAIQVAKEEADLERYTVVLMPKPIKFFERLLGIEEKDYMPVLKMLSEPYLYYEPVKLRVE